MEAFSAWPKKMPAAGSNVRAILMREYSIHFSRLLNTRRSRAGRTSSCWLSRVIDRPRRSSAFPPRATTTLMTLPPCRQVSRPSGVQAGPGSALTQTWAATMNILVARHEVCEHPVDKYSHSCHLYYTLNLAGLHVQPAPHHHSPVPPGMSHFETNFHASVAIDALQSNYGLARCHQGKELSHDTGAR